jgi:hypothetical protein
MTMENFLQILLKLLIIYNRSVSHEAVYIIYDKETINEPRPHRLYLFPKDLHICEQCQCVLGQSSLPGHVSKLLKGLGSTAEPRSPAHDPGRQVSHEYDQCLFSSLPS